MMVHDTIPLDHRNLSSLRLSKTMHACCRRRHDTLIASFWHRLCQSLRRRGGQTKASSGRSGNGPTTANTFSFYAGSRGLARIGRKALFRGDIIDRTSQELWPAFAGLVALAGENGRKHASSGDCGGTKFKCHPHSGSVGRGAGLRRRVHAVSGLSSPSLARLVAGCAALLSPSLAEGFGLPLLEGIAMGVPTIASDITAHREIAHATTTLLPPDNVKHEAAILSVARRHTIDIPPVPQHMTEAAFCHDILKFVEAVPPKGKGLSKLDGAPIKLEISA
jgi:hypothetical protein